MLKQRIRGGALLLVACFVNPCCAPLYVPLAIGLLAGTPAAAWLTGHLGWIYGAMTLLSVVSLVLGVRWLGGKRERAAQPPQPAPMPAKGADGGEAVTTA